MKKTLRLRYAEFVYINIYSKLPSFLKVFVSFFLFSIPLCIFYLVVSLCPFVLSYIFVLYFFEIPFSYTFNIGLSLGISYGMIYGVFFYPLTLFPPFSSCTDDSLFSDSY